MALSHRSMKEEEKTGFSGYHSDHPQLAASSGVPAEALVLRPCDRDSQAALRHQLVDFLNTNANEGAGSAQPHIRSFQATVPELKSSCIVFHCTGTWGGSLNYDS